ncbi:hypothetical protein TVNIR_1266 [Thioalkalivibrio nitratireducens DSM 14787]|uniref:Uncharacterized protein n=1 Tax=Thioalkalivibrio nitratireducens (strain DSM 14787 / UNIQEM 213 / ALEN2) TaxID=1255043 RepID=L0DTM1_THIND|nr:hypothetical protein TVNIR_1266 [Thioalkalivibrio nitratireducens DSM 14787]
MTSQQPVWIVPAGGAEAGDRIAGRTDAIVQGCCHTDGHSPGGLQRRYR